MNDNEVLFEENEPLYAERNDDTRRRNDKSTNSTWMLMFVHNQSTANYWKTTLLENQFLPLSFYAWCRNIVVEI